MPVVTRIGGRGDGAAVDDGPGCRRRADAAAPSSRGRDLGGRGPKRRVLRQADGGRAQTSLSWLADTLLSQDRAAPIRFCRPTGRGRAVPDSRTGRVSQRAARADREDRNREPALGRRPHPGRATRARLRGERGDGEMLSAEGAAASAVPVLANLPRQPPPAALGCGLLHRADAHLRDAVRLLFHHARAPPHRAFQRDGTSDSAVGVASVAGGDAVGAAAPLSDPGPRPLVRR